MFKEKPTFVLVPGAWHKPIIYKSVATHLKTHGYPTILLPLPSSGAIPPHEDFTQDVLSIRACLSALINLEHKEVILVVHSYTGLPGSEACRDLSQKSRLEKGQRGGVVRFVCINAFAMAEGFQPTPKGVYSSFPPWMQINASQNKTTVSSEDAKEIFYHDLPSPEEKEYWIGELDKYQSLGVYSSTLTYAVWRDVSSTYVQGMRDRSFFSQEVVEWMLGNARKEWEGAFDVVERCEEGGHCLMVGFAEWTAGALRRAAGEVC